MQRPVGPLLHLSDCSERCIFDARAQSVAEAESGREIQCVLLAQNMIKSNKNFTWSCWLLGFEKKKFLSSSLPRSGFKSIHMGCAAPLLVLLFFSMFDMPRDFCSLINGHSLCNCIISGSVPISHLLCAAARHPHTACLHTAHERCWLLCFYCSAISCCTSA